MLKHADDPLETNAAVKEHLHAQLQDIYHGNMGNLAVKSMPLPATGATSPRAGVSFSAEPVVLPKVAPTASSGVPPDAHDVVARTTFTWNTEDTFDSALTPAQLLCIMESTSGYSLGQVCVFRQRL